MFDGIRNVDFIIVGAGLAGIAFAETCINEGKSIFVFDNNSQNSSTVAAGLYNPVVLKRFTRVENALDQLNDLHNFYCTIHLKFNCIVDHKIPILRKFSSVEEINNWFVASDKSNLSTFLSPLVRSTIYHGIVSPFGFGEVLHTGFVDSALLLGSYHKYLAKNDLLSSDCFLYDKLIFYSEGVFYQNIIAKNIVFAEGFGVHSNPFFNYLPLDGTKGELFIIKCLTINLDVVINSSVYIIPIGNNLYKVGATYNWLDKSSDPSTEGRIELLDKLNALLNCDFEVISHFAGVRPTVRDRKVLLGTHPVHKNMHILNGLGTRGVMQGPWAAKILYNAIELDASIEKTINISRFEHLFANNAFTNQI